MLSQKASVNKVVFGRGFRVNTNSDACILYETVIIGIARIVPYFSYLKSSEPDVGTVLSALCSVMVVQNRNLLSLCNCFERAQCMKLMFAWTIEYECSQGGRE